MSTGDNTNLAAPTAAGCPEVYPRALRRGEIVECVRTGGHRKHENADGDLRWWGARLDAEELAEAERIRALGGVDNAKVEAWLDQLQLYMTAGADR